MCSRSPDPGAHMDKRTVNTEGRTSSCQHHGLELSHLTHLPQEHTAVPTIWCIQLSPVIWIYRVATRIFPPNCLRSDMVPSVIVIPDSQMDAAGRLTPFPGELRKQAGPRASCPP